MATISKMDFSIESSSMLKISQTINSLDYFEICIFFLISLKCSSFIASVFSSFNNLVFFFKLSNYFRFDIITGCYLYFFSIDYNYSVTSSRYLFTILMLISLNGVSKTSSTGIQAVSTKLQIYIKVSYSYSIVCKIS